MKKEIVNSTDVRWLVDRFYDKIRQDKIVGYIFNDVMKVKWDKHLPVMYAFWENALFYTGSYDGNAMKKHLNINRITPLQKKHFNRWLELFNETVDEYFEGEKAVLAKQRARSIAAIIQVKIAAEHVK